MRRTTRTCLILVVVAGSSIDAFAEPIPDALAARLDPDFVAALDSARDLLDHGDAAHAAETILRMHRGTDRFTLAQKELLTEPSRALLVRAAHAHLAASQLELAAQDLDGAWQLAGRSRDPEYSATLVRWAERIGASQKGEALYLARRARIADSGNTRAVALDLRLSTNPYHGASLATGILGLLGVSAGAVVYLLANRTESDLKQSVHSQMQADALLAQRSNFYLGTWIALGTGGAMLIVSAVLHFAGKPRHAPISPALLPALPEAQ
jgi:hypothetical protein